MGNWGEGRAGKSWLGWGRSIEGVKVVLWKKVIVGWDSTELPISD